MPVWNLLFASFIRIDGKPDSLVWRNPLRAGHRAGPNPCFRIHVRCTDVYLALDPRCRFACSSSVLVPYSSILLLPSHPLDGLCSFFPRHATAICLHVSIRTIGFRKFRCRNFRCQSLQYLKAEGERCPPVVKGLADKPTVVQRLRCTVWRAFIEQPARRACTVWPVSGRRHFYTKVLCFASVAYRTEVS